jgi:hypothetical protein
MAARTGPADLLQPALALGVTRPRDQALDGRGIQFGVRVRNGYIRLRTASNVRVPAARRNRRRSRAGGDAHTRSCSVLSRCGRYS